MNSSLLGNYFEWIWEEHIFRICQEQFWVKHFWTQLPHYNKIATHQTQNSQECWDCQPQGIMPTKNVQNWLIYYVIQIWPLPAPTHLSVKSKTGFNLSISSFGWWSLVLFLLDSFLIFKSCLIIETVFFDNLVSYWSWTLND